MATKIQKKEPQKQIVIPFGMKRELARLLKCGEATVYLALKGKLNSPLASSIRGLAIKKLQELNN